MIYTGTMNFSHWGFYYQSQGMARPANASDPWLQEWIKDPEPLAMPLPVGGSHAQW